MSAQWSDASPVIEIAKGIVMATRGCPPDEAFELLSEAARGNDMSVSDLAECLVAYRDVG